MSLRATYVAVEGVDGSGKSTFAKGLAGYLRVVLDAPVRVHREPGGPTRFGDAVRELLKDPVHEMDEYTRTLLFFADRHYHASDLLGWLYDGVHVVSDRSYVSSLVYQGARGVNPGFMDDLISGLQLQHPNLFVYVDTPVEVAQARLAARWYGDDDRYDADVALQEQVKEAYDLYFKDNTWFAPFVRIDGSRPFTDDDYARVLQAMHNCHVPPEEREHPW